jgi:hypothetical protein
MRYSAAGIPMEDSTDHWLFPLNHDTVIANAKGLDFLFDQTRFISHCHSLLQPGGSMRAIR